MYIACLTLCDPMDCSLPGSSVHGIFQTRTLEWIAISTPGNLPDPGIKPASVRLLHWQAGSHQLSHRESHMLLIGCPVMSDSLRPRGL